MLIAGATASGKSAAALALADEAGRLGSKAWIVNADAMQVYGALRVLTARPGPADEARIPHRLYGHVAAGARYSVGAWLADMEAVLDEARGEGALVIAAGGTGLYFKGLTEGISSIPAVPADVRAGLAHRLKDEGVAALHAALAERDPATAEAIRPNDPQRVLRAFEVLDATGVGLSEWQRRGRMPPLLPLETTVPLVLDVDRATLHARIEARVDRMVGDGALEEVRALIAGDLDPHLPVMKAIGVRAFAAHLAGKIPLDVAVARVKTETRRYAKRQSTWLRNQMADWPRDRLG